MDNIIEIKNLNKSFQKGKIEQKVLENLHIEIKDKEMTALTGRSGSGKTTLLNIISGIIPMDTGDYFFYKQKIDISNSLKADSFRNKYFGIVHQHARLLSDYTILENISLPLHYQKKSKKDIIFAVENIANQLNIKRHLNKLPSQLSGGEQQRVTIARALITNPLIICADEPTGSLDKNSENEVMNIFKELNMKGKVIIIVTHSDNVSNYCDKIIKID